MIIQTDLCTTLWGVFLYIELQSWTTLHLYSMIVIVLNIKERNEINTNYTNWKLPLFLVKLIFNTWAQLEIQSCRYFVRVTLGVRLLR